MVSQDTYFDLISLSTFYFRLTPPLSPHLQSTYLFSSPLFFSFFYTLLSFHLFFLFSSLHIQHSWCCIFLGGGGKQDITLTPPGSVGPALTPSKSQPASAPSWVSSSSASWAFTVANTVFYFLFSLLFFSLITQAIL